MKILRGGGSKSFIQLKGGSEKIRGGEAPKICILQNQQEGGLQKFEPIARGGC